MIRNFLITAYRNIIRNKIYSMINVAGLSIGLAVGILLFLWVQNELSYDRFHENKERIFSVIQKGIWNNDEVYGNTTIPYILTPLMHQSFPEIEEHVRLRTLPERMVQFEDKIFFEDILLTESGLFGIFSFKLLKGDPDLVLEDKYSMVVTESTSRKYFGEADPVGKVLRYSNRLDFTVTGIIEDPPENSSVRFDVLAPFKILGEERINGWSWESSGYILLREGVDAAEFSGKIENFIRENNPENDNTVRIQPLTMRHLYGPLDEPQALTFVIIFAAIGILVLLIACINFMNLATARSMKRAREVGIRKVVGAERGSLIRQFLGESMLVTIIAMLLAIIIVELLMPMFNQLAARNLGINFTDPVFLSFLFLITIIVGFVSGSYPAIYLSRYEPEKVLKGSRSSRNGAGFRRVLVVFQFTVSIALIISTLIILNQMRFIRNKDLGFTREQIVSIPNNGELRESYSSFKEELLKDPSIIGVTSASTSPAEVGNVNPALWEGKQDEERILFNFYLVEHDFLEVFDMELVAGTNFTKDVAEGEEFPYIVNEAAVKIMGLEDPVGKRFSMYNEDNAGRIIGVVKDYHFQRLTNDIGPIMITTANWWRSLIFVKLRPEGFQQQIDHIENIYKRFSPNFPFEYTFLDEDIEALYGDFYEMGSIIKYFAILAILISCLGLFGLATFSTEQRKKEICIRKVLGSSVSGLILLFLRSFTRWILVANIIAWPLAYYAMKEFLGMFAYKTDINPLLFILSAIMALLIAGVTVIYQTLKAAYANPVEALKYE